MLTEKHKKPLVVITGPTASGKSDLAVRVAKKINGEIITADSAQVYRDLLVITARVAEREMKGISHHLTGFLDMGHEFSLADFQKLAYDCIRDIVSRGKVPILVGGTALYIKAVAEAYQLPDIHPDPGLRAGLHRKALEVGKEVLYDELKRIDPEAASRIHPNNLRRIIRAIEVIEQTGRLFSSFYGKTSPHPLGVEPAVFVVELPRDELYDRINRRVDQMMEAGALEEIKKPVDSGKKELLMDSKILGCRELIYILEGKCTLQEGINLLKRNTRNFAKRQLTWFRSFKNMNPVIIDGREPEAGIEKIIRRLGGSFEVNVNNKS